MVSNMMLNKMLFKFMVDKPHRSLPPILGGSVGLPLHSQLWRNSIDKSILGQKKVNREAGFSILEILVTILVISGFLLGALQGTVLATLFRIQAQDKQEAANWIQQDLELIKFQAFTLQGTTGTGTPTSGSDATQCTSTVLANKYGTYLQNKLATAGYTVSQGIAINSKSYRVFRKYTVPTASPNILQINYTVAYAPAISSTNQHPRYKSSASYNLGTGPTLGNPNIVSTLSTEILPNAALNCN